MRRPAPGGSRPTGRLAGCLAAVVLLLVGCGGTTAGDVDSGYVGALDGTDAFVGLVVSETNAAVYVCDGEGGIAEYLWGPVTASGSVALDGPTGAGVRATLVDGVFTGTVTLPDGAVHPFSAERATGGAGTYLVVGEQAVAAGVSGGWVVGNDGAERGALLRNGSFRRTPRLPVGGLVLDGEGFATTRLVVGTDVEQRRSVTASEVVAPDDLADPAATVGPDAVLRVPSPAGPIPVPLPNTPLPVLDTSRDG